jgi:hypothetical protein
MYSTYPISSDELDSLERFDLEASKRSMYLIELFSEERYMTEKIEERFPNWNSSIALCRGCGEMVHLATAC